MVSFKLGDETKITREELDVPKAPGKDVVKGHKYCGFEGCDKDLTKVWQENKVPRSLRGDDEEQKDLYMCNHHLGLLFGQKSADSGSDKAVFSSKASKVLGMELDFVEKG